MITYNVLYILLAALGLGILVFLHEWGHYLVARREKMKVEVFSIGFGKPIFSWEKEGVSWQVGMIPFGGYVKIAGTEKKGSLEPYQIKDGFYGKGPGARIRVALAGPLVNIVLAFVLFCAIWILGGRKEPFAEHTHFLGWVDPESELFAEGVRPGDEILTYNGKPFEGVRQLLYGSLLSSGEQTLQGLDVDYFANQSHPFTYVAKPITSLNGQVRAPSLLAMINPAAYLLYKEDAVSVTTPLKESGIQAGDRLLWVDGELIFSRRQLVEIVNKPRTLLTVVRGKDVFLAQVPRLAIGDLRLSAIEKAELQDVAYATGWKEKIDSLYYIPYKLSSAGVLEKSFAYIDEHAFEQKAFVAKEASAEKTLLPGDRIIAVDGQRVDNASQCLSVLQQRKVQVMVKRLAREETESFAQAEKSFIQGIDITAMEKLAAGIGQETRAEQEGSIYLLRPVEPKPFSSLAWNTSLKEKLAVQLAEQRRQIEEIKKPKERESALQELELEQKRLLLGGIFEDQQVWYNPSPFVLFREVCVDIQRTLSALCTGVLSPKYLSGPVGIVHAVKGSIGLGLQTALYWLAVVSLNLGVLNLLPIPVLDGGHICFALYEKITGRRIKAKVMERLIVPFVVLLVAFFLYATYHDILRIVKFW